MYIFCYICTFKCRVLSLSLIITSSLLLLLLPWNASITIITITNLRLCYCCSSLSRRYTSHAYQPSLALNIVNHNTFSNYFNGPHRAEQTQMRWKNATKHYILPLTHALPDPKLSHWAISKSFPRFIISYHSTWGFGCLHTTCTIINYFYINTSTPYILEKVWWYMAVISNIYILCLEYFGIFYKIKWFSIFFLIGNTDSNCAKSITYTN